MTKILGTHAPDKAYPWTHRAVEIAATALYLAILLVTLYVAVWSGFVVGVGGWIWAVSAVLAGLVAADFVSGFVHWLADSFGSVKMPFFGAAFIAPFREHHYDPLKITRHDFIQVNGNNCVVILMFLPFVVAVQSLVSAKFAAWLELWTVAFTIAIFLTNQVHSWAHAERVPKAVRWLQRTRIILNAADHDRHHTEPHDTYFCITFGWLNPLLEKTRFFPLMTKLGTPFLPPSDGHIEDAHAE